MQTMFKPVTVYSQPGCAPCARIKKLLDQAGIEYDDIDVTKDQAARDYVVNDLKASGTPVVVDERGPIIGTKPDEWKALIEYHTASETGL
ncbi:NrdH-like glutaredoxin [Gordonia phage Nedarya]|nr:NrdH-like glutaredoxin [Gordonia phage Nedarya]